MTSKFRFTKKELEALEIQKDRKRYYDTGVPGLIVEVYPNGRKSFRVYKKVRGAKAATQVTIGVFPDLTIDQARSKAREIINEMALGINPNDKKKSTENESVSLQRVFDDYLIMKKLSENTVRGYKQVINAYLTKYINKPLALLTEEVIKQIHTTITNGEFKGMRKPSKAQADLCMRVVRALFNFAKYEYRGYDNTFIFVENPVTILSHQRSWHNVERKSTYVRPHQLKKFLHSVAELRKEFALIQDQFALAVCDLVEFALFTGLRKNELLTLPWSQVDLPGKAFYVSETKNGTPLELPISPYLMQLFENRKLKCEGREFVFYADNDKGYVVEPKKVIKKIADKSEHNFTLHDLRRTFTTIAESVNIGTYSIKRLLNHKSRRDDVTAGYTVLTPEELRKPALAIENKILEIAEVKTETSSEDDLNVNSLVNSLTDIQKKEMLAMLFKEIHTN